MDVVNRIFDAEILVFIVRNPVDQFVTKKTMDFVAELKKGQGVALTPDDELKVMNKMTEVRRSPSWFLGRCSSWERGLASHGHGHFERHAPVISAFPSA